MKRAEVGDAVRAVAEICTSGVRSSLSIAARMGVSEVMEERVPLLGRNYNLMEGPADQGRLAC